MPVMGREVGTGIRNKISHKGGLTKIMIILAKN